MNLPEFIEFISLSGKEETVTIIPTNITDTAINFSSISTNNTAFAISNNNCTGILESGESCELKLTYKPENNTEETLSELIIDLADGNSVYIELVGLNLAAFNDEFGEMGNDFDWYADDDWAFEDDGFSLDSSNLNTDDFSYLTAEVDGEGIFEFDFNFEDENEGNYCQYYVDDELVRTVRGSQRNTAHHSTVLSKGKHTITWKFKKQANSNGKLKITNLKMTKETSISPVASTENVATQTASDAPRNGGGGSSSFLLLSGLALMLGSLKRRFRKRH